MPFDTIQRIWQRLASGWTQPWELLVELLLIGLSVNWCASVLQGTRGTRLIRGLLIMLVAVTLIVRILSAQLGWTRLELLYRYFVTGLAFIALVAFQPELRRALIRAGEVRLFRRGGGGDKLVGALVEAAGQLTRKRHGALIAIQRDVGLANWTENGVEMHAEVTAPLLQSIFYPNSPLHDLGIIIRGHRVIAASCQFPMAESGEVDPILGSRHRAAVGMSQESDALVIVVSEETGALSLADQGELLRVSDLDTLGEELARRLGNGRFSDAGPGRTKLLSATSWKRGLRRLAIVAPLTLVIWFLADQASLIRLSTQAELSIKHDADIDAAFLGPSPGALSLVLRGPTRQIDAVRDAAGGKPWRLEWPLAAPFNRPGTVCLTADDLARILSSLRGIQDRGLMVESVSPSTIDLRIEPVATELVPVQPASASLRLTDIRVEPGQVKVRVRRSEWEALPEAARVITVEVDRDLADAALDQPVTLTDVTLPSRIGGVELLRVEPPTVQISARIAPNTVRKSLRSIPVQVVAPPNFLSQYDVRPVDEGEWLLEIEVEGNRARVEPLEAASVLAQVNVSTGSPDSEPRTAEVSLVLPQGVRLIGPARLVQYKIVARDSAPP